MIPGDDHHKLVSVWEVSCSLTASLLSLDIGSTERKITLLSKLMTVISNMVRQHSPLVGGDRFANFRLSLLSLLVRTPALTQIRARFDM